LIVIAKEKGSKNIENGIIWKVASSRSCEIWKKI